MLDAAANISSEIGIPIGIGGSGLAALIFYFYRQERDRSKQLADTALSALTKCLTDNTQALTKLTDVVTGLESRTVCPFGQQEMNTLRQLLKKS